MDLEALNPTSARRKSLFEFVLVGFAGNSSVAAAALALLLVWLSHLKVFLAMKVLQSRA